MTITKMQGFTLTDTEGNDVFYVDVALAEHMGSKIYTATFCDATANAAWDDSFYMSFKSEDELNAYVAEGAEQRGLEIA